jgi:hypothetical protein
MSDDKQPSAQPGAGAGTGPSSDIPNSVDPKDIQSGLDTSPEYLKMQKLQERLLELNEATRTNLEALSQADPSDTETIQKHRDIHAQNLQKIKELSNEFSDTTKAAAKPGPAPGGNKTLHFPLLDKLVDAIMEILKALLKLVGKGVALVRNMFPKGPGSGQNEDGATNDPSSNPKKSSGTVIGVNLPGGPVTVKPPVEKTPPDTSPEDAEDSLNKAMDAGEARQVQIKKELAATELENDEDSPAFGQKGVKPI